MPILIQLLIGLAVIGTVLAIANKLWTTIDPRVKYVMNALAGLFLFIWVLYCVSEFFGWGWFNGVNMMKR